MTDKDRRNVINNARDIYSTAVPIQGWSLLYLLY